MLILTRGTGESIWISDNIEVKVLKIDRTQVKLGIDAPINIPVHREEVRMRIDAEKKAEKAEYVDAEFDEINEKEGPNGSI
jgi:carbon storage regulator